MRAVAQAGGRSVFGSLYEDDLYSGAALAHDLGADEVLAVQARRVHRVFKKHGVKTVITWIRTPPTCCARSIPRLVPDYDVRVRSYLEVLVEKG